MIAQLPCGPRARCARLSLAALALAGPAWDAAAASPWHRQVNARFAFSADVPADFTPEPPPENGDGRRYTSPDRQGTVAVYGHYLVTATDMAGDEAELAASEAADGLALSYKARGSGGYTLSGLMHGRIVYIRTVSTCGGDAVATLRAEYPVYQKARYDALIAHMGSALRGSAGRPPGC